MRNLGEFIKKTIEIVQPIYSNLEEDDIGMITNMILTVLSRSSVISPEEAFHSQIPIQSGIFDLGFMEDLWFLMDVEVETAPNLITPLEGNNREGDNDAT